MEKSNFRDPKYWEKLACQKYGHHKVVKRLRQIINSEYQLELGKYNDAWKELVWIMKRETSPKGKRIEKPTRVHYCVPYIPDILIKYKQNPNSWVYLDYINTGGKNEHNFVRVYRGLIALEAVMRVRKTEYKRFVVAVRDSLYDDSTSRASIKWGDFVGFKIERLSLTYVIKLLEEKRLQNE